MDGEPPPGPPPPGPPLDDDLAPPGPDASAGPAAPLADLLPVDGIPPPPPMPEDEAPMDFPSSAVPQAPPKINATSGPLVLIPLCRKGDRVGIERQLQAGANIEECDIEGNTPLHVAVEAPKNEIATVQTLLENGANPNAVNYLGATPLHYVCLRKSNWRGVANILLEMAAQIDAQTLGGKTPLHFACENQLPELTEVLCLFAADVNLLDNEGNSPMHLAIGREGGRDTVKRQIIEYLVQYEGRLATPNCQGLTPLHLACKTGAIRCVQFLLEQGADVFHVTSRQQTCLHLACHGGHTEVTQLLLQVNSAARDQVDAEGNTALHICAMVGSLDCASLLLKMEACTTIKNSRQKTALELSKLNAGDLHGNHNRELVQALKEAHKDSNCRQS
eukprot:TRINITY_DN91636_c0_g1_i1.p1 TRINITY_DN91636_c0_g1~~TRINITY_DN91636_c0_g1_i1.p1  ORF type:complete len:390 (+),score=75.71 TRINITY_DN91636_c0_g1_i1:159-1328(+)